jgi:pimeloyl-ACP methyl ester carboxylesterase
MIRASSDATLLLPRDRQTVGESAMFRNAPRIVRNLATALILSGSLIGCSAMKNGSMAAVTPVTTTQPRVGTVYLLRGWIGIFSTGIDKLGDEINAAGVHAQVYQESQWSTLASTIIEKYENQPNHEPIVIVGHSYGADDSILIARKLAEKNIKVQLVVTLDPVTPRKVPANATLVYNLYQTGALDGLPFLRGIALTPDSPGPVTLLNMNIRKDRTDLLDKNLDHFNIEKKEKIHADVLAQVLKACPPRAAWAMSHPSTPAIMITSTFKPTPAAPAPAAAAKPAVVAAAKPAVAAPAVVAPTVAVSAASYVSTAAPTQR